MSETAKKITKKELQNEIVKLKADLDLYKSKTISQKLSDIRKRITRFKIKI